MTTAELDLQFPPIVPPPEAPTTAVALPTPKTLTVAEFVRAQFAGHEPTLTMLAAKHKADKVVIGTGRGTTEGAKSLTAAKAIRAELREHGRFAVQRALDALKKDLNGAKDIAAAEAARLIAIVEPVEKVYDEAIKAEEARIEKERQDEEDRKRVRREGFQQAIRGILEYQRAAAGLSAERIARGLVKLEMMEFDPEHWAEFLDDAKQAHAETLDALRKMHAEAVRLEALEAENARLRAEALDRAQEALAAAPAASPAAEKVAEVAAEVVSNAARAALPPHDPETGEVFGDAERQGAITEALEQVRAEMVAAPTVQPPVAHDPCVIKLGDIAASVGKGFTMTSEFCETVLGVPGENVKASYCYTAAGRRALLEALIRRVQEVM